MSDDPWKRMFAPPPGLMSPSQARAGLLAGPMAPQPPLGLLAASPQLLNWQSIYSALHGPGPRQRTGGHSGGLLEPGNIDLKARPQVKMPNGETATVRSMSVSFDNGTFLIPTVSDDGRIMSEDEAIRTFQKTGRHLGRFSSVGDADRYSHSLSAAQGRYYKPGGDQ